MFGKIIRALRGKPDHSGTQAVATSVPAPVAAAAPTPSPTTPVTDALALANAAAREHDFVRAVEYYRTALQQQQSGKPEVYLGLGYALLQTGELEQAQATLSEAVRLAPENVEAHFLLGQIYRMGGLLNDAEASWLKVHALAPEFPLVYDDLCLLLMKHGKLGQAETLMRTAVQKYPQQEYFHVYLGNVLSSQGRPRDAEASYRAALAITPGEPHALNNLSNALRELGQLDESISMSRESLRQLSDNAMIFSNYLFSLQYSDKLSNEEKFQEHLRFAEVLEAPLKAHWPDHTKRARHGGRLRIGYVSADLRNHSLAYFIEPILRRHDRSRFELFAYYAAPLSDDVTRRMQGYFEHWLDCEEMSDEALAQRIWGDGIDILVDLSGHTGYNRLLTFARKPAPVQITWLGYQATTGLSAMDYRFTDVGMDPDGTGDQYFTEKLLRLPFGSSFEAAPDAPDVGPLPVLTGSPFTFGCLNNPSKIVDPCITLWARVLLRCPGARLMLGSSTPELQTTLSAKFAAHGVDTGRLRFVPKLPLRDYLALHHQIDLALDTFPYNGGTTSFHSLWMGVPVLVLLGDNALSRVGVSLMRSLGFTDYCADNEADYENRAVDFYTHPNKLLVAHDTLREKMRTSNDLNGVQMTQALEQTYLDCWQTFLDRC